MIIYLPVASWVGIQAVIHSSNKSCNLSPFPQCFCSVSSYVLRFSSVIHFLTCWCHPDLSLSFLVSCPELYDTYRNAQKHYAVQCANVYEKQKSPNSKDMCACMLYAHSKFPPPPPPSLFFSPYFGHEILWKQTLKTVCHFLEKDRQLSSRHSVFVYFLYWLNIF